MKKYTEENIRNLVINSFFNCEEEVPTFSHYWDCEESEDREKLVEVMTAFWVRHFELVNGLEE